MRFTIAVRLAGAVGLLHAGCAASDGGARYDPSAGLDRLEYESLHGTDVGLVQDFDMSGDTIYLLDRTGRVAIVVREGAGLVLSGHFSRRGPGPGELLQPTGIAAGRESIVIVDGTRLLFFSRTGQPLATATVSLPCPMMLPTIAESRTGLFIAGGCFRSGYASDTMKSVLAWSPDTVTWRIVAEAPRYTRDGSVGSVFGARSLLTTGVTDIHSFGGGEINCIWEIADAAAAPSATRHCPAASILYSADPPPGVKSRLGNSRVPGMTIRWPETLPAYTDRFVSARGVVLLRPFSADSLVLQLAGAAPLDIAVAPLDGLIGCRRGGCVWLRDDGDAPRMIVLDRAAIERRLAAVPGT
jgi:hypothetical protein